MTTETMGFDITSEYKFVPIQVSTSVLLAVEKARSREMLRNGWWEKWRLLHDANLSLAITADSSRWCFLYDSVCFQYHADTVNACKHGNAALP